MPVEEYDENRRYNDRDADDPRDRAGRSALHFNDSWFVTH